MSSNSQATPGYHDKARGACASTSKVDMQIKRKGDLSFQLIKHIIIAENKALLEIVARTYGIPLASLTEKYLRPEYYLPLVTKDKS